jgi:DNA-directed RNA polymerase subunit RPC12/RpoP
MFFRCKNCGGNVVYSPEKHKMFCPFCESEQSDERAEGSSPEMKICPNCGGEVPVEEHTSATQCPYCDTYLIFNERVEKKYQPKLIIPFQLGKETCKESIREKFRRNLFAPTDFLSEVRLNGMQGYYVPYWLYNYDTHCEFRGEGTKVRSWDSGKMRYTETSYFSVVRDMDIAFRRIPVDASIQMPDDVMDLMEPYQYNQLQAFQPEFMSGFYGEKYNFESPEIENRAHKKMQEDAKTLLRASYSGYTAVKPLKEDVRAAKGEAEYGLLPVWKYLYTYNGQEYPFYVNGQTGKIVGIAPLSKKKLFAYAGTLFVCLTAILSMVPLLAAWL